MVDDGWNAHLQKKWAGLVIEAKPECVVFKRTLLVILVGISILLTACNENQSRVIRDSQLAKIIREPLI